MKNLNTIGSKQDVCNKLLNAMLKDKDTITVNVNLDGNLKSMSFVLPKLKGTLMQKRTYGRIKAGEIYSNVGNF